MTARDDRIREIEEELDELRPVRFVLTGRAKSPAYARETPPKELVAWTLQCDAREKEEKATMHMLVRAEQWKAENMAVRYLKDPTVTAEADVVGWLFNVPRLAGPRGVP